MTRSELGLIWAQARGGVIGADGGMPWHLPEDLARFKALTLTDTVVMGRKTWESIPPRFRPLVDRRNIVVTRDESFVAPGAEVAHSVEEALELAGPEAWVMGGAQLYAATIARADRLEVTEIDVEVDGDAHAPQLDEDWVAVATAPAEPGEWWESRTGLRYRFVSYRRAAR
ncbi:dihydrofolate reductase [uncultured Schumannella sp.]|uniref:dihydrofolate reductase n=1 Tax=uncultured Schumannella sp. TaxID=1195956 RepID=UPI0025F33981|nr:dihydrofolate reductase [uncultured Schumannella sp.]